MDNREFKAAWEVEYLCARIRRIEEAVENGNYESALDMLSMIQDKAKAAENVIKDESKKEQFVKHMRKNFSNKIVIQSCEEVTECVRCGQPVAGILHCSKCLDEIALEQMDKGLDGQVED